MYTYINGIYTYVYLCTYTYSCEAKIHVYYKYILRVITFVIIFRKKWRITCKIIKGIYYVARAATLVVSSVHHSRGGDGKKRKQVGNVRGSSWIWVAAECGIENTAFGFISSFYSYIQLNFDWNADDLGGLIFTVSRDFPDCGVVAAPVVPDATVNVTVHNVTEFAESPSPASSADTPGLSQHGNYVILVLLSPDFLFVLFLLSDQSLALHLSRQRMRHSWYHVTHNAGKRKNLKCK